MPSFFTDILGFDLESAGILCVFPYMALFFSSIAFGAMFEYFQNHRGWSIDQIRQWAEYIAFVGSAGGLLICGFMDNQYAAYVFMIITQVSFLSFLSLIFLLCFESNLSSLNRRCSDKSQPHGLFNVMERNGSLP